MITLVFLSHPYPRLMTTSIDAYVRIINQPKRHKTQQLKAKVNRWMLAQKCSIKTKPRKET
jgi:hypothetical protein